MEVSGSSIGTVSSIALTPNGHAELTLDITDKHFSPLRQGTTATIRETSLSGIANRYVNLMLGPAGAPAIRSGGFMPSSSTTSEVDLDQIFNTLDARTRKGLQDVIQGSAAQYKGYGPAARKAFVYLNPAIATASMLFRELNHDTSKFTRFIVNSGNLVSDLAQRSSDLSGLVQHLGTTTQALAAQRTALGQSIQRLPGFMALADTTFVNLRSALDDLKPLVDASVRWRRSSRSCSCSCVRWPTTRCRPSATSRTSSAAPGADNDLTDIARLGVPLANATVRNVNVNGESRPGAFPESVTALNGSTPELAFARPYAVDLTGWFEGFSHPGVIDANGATSRVVAALNPLDLAAGGALNGLPTWPAADRDHQAAQHLGAAGAEAPDHRLPGRSLPGLDGARRALVPRERAIRVTPTRCRPAHEARASRRSDRRSPRARSWCSPPARPTATRERHLQDRARQRLRPRPRRRLQGRRRARGHDQVARPLTRRRCQPRSSRVEVTVRAASASSTPTRSASPGPSR